MKKQPLGHYRPRWTSNRFCHWCGDAFEATRQDARFCSARCRKAMNRSVNREMEKLELEKSDKGNRSAANV